MRSLRVYLLCGLQSDTANTVASQCRPPLGLYSQQRALMLYLVAYNHE